MTINIRYRVSYLTYVAITNHNKAAKSQAIEATRVDDVAAHEEVARAKAHTKETNAQTTQLLKKFEDFQKQVFVMIQSGQAGPSIAPSSAHPTTHFDYVDESYEQLVDEDENE